MSFAKDKIVRENKSFQLVVCRGASEGVLFELHPGDNLIGRWDPESGAFPEVDLEEADTDAKVSRKHASLEISDGVATLLDLGSLNGTGINNGKALEPGVRYHVAIGDEIRIGNTFLRLAEGEQQS